MSGETLLVIDDTPSNLSLVRVVLAARGYRVITATGAEEALLLLADRLPDLILTDIQMPGMDGLELTRRLKADGATCHIPVVALTAHAMKGDEEKALAAGCAAYITKPIDIHGFPDQVARAMMPR